MESLFQRLAPRLVLALSFGSFGPLASALPQEPAELLLVDGDEIWPMAPILAIQQCGTNDSGDWWATVIVDFGGSSGEYAWLVNGSPVAWSGQPVGTGFNPSVIRHGSLDENGNQFLLIVEGFGPTAPTRLLVNDTLVLSDGDVLSGIPGSTGPFDVSRIQGVSHGGGRLVVSLTTAGLSPTSPLPFAVVSFDVSSTGAVTSPRLDYATGMPLVTTPGRFRTVQGGPSVSSDGSLTQPLLYRLMGTDYKALFIEGQEALVEGQVSPIPGADWVSPALKVASSAGGRFATTGTVLDGAGDLIDIVVSGDMTSQQLVAAEGADLSAYPGDPIANLTSTAVAIDDAGQTAFTAALASGTQHLMHAGRSLIQTGVTQAEGRSIARVQSTGAGAYRPMALSAGGGWLVAVVEFANGDSGIVRFDLDRGTQVASCPAAPNSTGLVAVLESYGSRSLAADLVTLRARDLPPQAFGLLVASKSTGFVSGPGGSDGTLCLGGQIHRFDGAIASSGQAGVIESRIRLSTLPPTTAVLTGETLYFQQWHREVVPGSTSNFTTAVGVTFL